MKDPTTKSELLQVMRTARTEWEALVTQVPARHLSEPVAPGQWSIQEIIVHVTEYDRRLALGLAMRLQKPPRIWLEDLSLDDFNARLHQQIAGRQADEILLDSHQVFQDLITEVEAHSEAYLFGTHHVEGVPDAVIPSQILKSESYGHYQDHFPALRAWLASYYHETE